MHPFDALSPDEQLEAIRLAAAAALRRYDLPAGATVTLINHSENATYRIDDPAGGGKWALRVHREDYHTRRGIESELEWMRALRDDADVHTPVPIAGRDGEPIQAVADARLPRPRYCVLFEWIDGVEPDEDGDLLGPFEQLGEVTARTHRHSRGWTRPANFERLVWDFETTLGGKPNWGPWRAAPGLDENSIELFGRMGRAIARRLEGFGKDALRYGLIHADFRLANLMICEGDTRVIDFDDCGSGWYLYDLATALSFMEERPDVPDLVAAWLKGYRRVIPVSVDEEEEIPTFLMLRRMLILAWMGSHAETDLAKELGVPYTETSRGLAEEYLAKFG